MARWIRAAQPDGLSLIPWDARSRGKSNFRQVPQHGTPSLHRYYTNKPIKGFFCKDLLNKIGIEEKAARDTDGVTSVTQLRVTQAEVLRFHGSP